MVAPELLVVILHEAVRDLQPFAVAAYITALKPGHNLFKPL
jgi:hypothetical protein